MAKQNKQVIEDNKVTEEKFEVKDFAKVAELVCDTWNTRCQEEGRRTEEKIWKEIDRQIDMEPDVGFKTLSGASGSKLDPNKAWMPEIELPLQAQTLEVLTSDARRFMFPGGQPWFKAHPELTDEMLERAAKVPLIAGDTTGITSQINQSNMQHLITSYLGHFHKQYDFQGNIDAINCEAFKYGVGVSRTRPVMKRVVSKTAKGPKIQDKIIPVTFPVSIKRTYLDSSVNQLANEGVMIGSAMISEKDMLLVDLVLAANSGKTGRPEDFDGGWMPAQLAGLNPYNTNGTVKVIEYEGDMVLPLDTRTEFFPGAIVSVVVGRSEGHGKGVVIHRVIRFRSRGTKKSSYTEFHYHSEHMNRAYSSSPLKKGYPIQMAATEAFSRMMQSAILNTEPVCVYDSADAYLAAMGGPAIFPGSNVPTSDIGSIKFEKIGDPLALLNTFGQLLQLYADMTGVNQPRLGQQTKSHTTAFAKEAELQRGTVRTVDYVESQLVSSMTQILDKEYELAREIGGDESIYVDEYQTFVRMGKELLPENVEFEVLGSAAPSDDKAREVEKNNAILTAINLDPVKVQMGGKPMNIEKIQKQLLQTAGFINAEEFFNSGNESQAQGTQAGLPIPGADGGIGSAAPAAIQALEGFLG